ncbi:MAG: S24 family peptidase [Alphaproteobacteria bacterium]|nr:S24 family peptidase [Alphaproteobacteria bacterium]
MKSDEIRRYLHGLIEARSLTLSEVSRAIGRNHAYLQQYLMRGSPRILPEEIRIKLGEYLGVDAQNFSPLRDTTTRQYQREVSAIDRKDHIIGNANDRPRVDKEETSSELGQRMKTGFSPVSSARYTTSGTSQAVGGVLRDRVIPPNFLPNSGHAHDHAHDTDYSKKQRSDHNKLSKSSRNSAHNIIEIDGNLYLLVPFLSRKWGEIGNDRNISPPGKTAQAPIPYPLSRLGFLSQNDIDDLRMVEIIGDRMSPSINHGDMVMIDMSTQNFQGDGVYVIAGNSQEIIMCRCLEKFGTRKLTLYYDNQAWPAQEISDPSQLNIIGKVVWIGHNIGV